MVFEGNWWVVLKCVMVTFVNQAGGFVHVYLLVNQTRKGGNTP